MESTWTAWSCPLGQFKETGPFISKLEASLCCLHEYLKKKIHQLPSHKTEKLRPTQDNTIQEQYFLCPNSLKLLRGINYREKKLQTQTPQNNYEAFRMQGALLPRNWVQKPANEKTPRRGTRSSGPLLPGSFGTLLAFQAPLKVAALPTCRT